MCGLIDSSGSNLDILSQATDYLSRRGPDHSEVFLDHEAGVGLGHRRLSIRDLLPHGHQPMVSQDGAALLVFSGEIYDFVSCGQNRLRILLNVITITGITDHDPGTGDHVQRNTHDDLDTPLVMTFDYACTDSKPMVCT